MYYSLGIGLWGESTETDRNKEAVMTKEFTVTILPFLVRSHASLPMIFFLLFFSLRYIFKKLKNHAFQLKKKEKKKSSNS